MWARLKQKPFSLWVIAAGVFYLGLALLGLIVLLAIAMGFLFGGGILLLLLIFVAVFFIAGVFVLREKRWAYVTAAAVSLVFFFLNRTEISSSIANPADAFFWLGFSSVPTLILVVAFSILDFRSAKTGLRQRRSLASAQSTGGILTFALSVSRLAAWSRGRSARESSCGTFPRGPRTSRSSPAHPPPRFPSAPRCSKLPWATPWRGSTRTRPPIP